MISEIAILATGDEIIQGDILNTNAQTIAKLLIDNDLNPGQHLTIADNEGDITEGILYLLDHHDTLIIMGGLGPTSDDVTRFALAHALKHELIFNKQCWQHVINKIKRFNRNIPDSNKRQCYFPEGATLLDNPHGTAIGCHICSKGKSIFMLPGPPKECLSMFSNHVLPKLLEHHKPNNNQRFSWLLLNVSESTIAEKIEPLMQGSNCRIGYRIAYPYLQVKLFGNDKKDFSHQQQRIHDLIQPNLISTDQEAASQLLTKFILERQIKMNIVDDATRGHLQRKLIFEKTHSLISFKDTGATADLYIQIIGLNTPWEEQGSSNLEITIRDSDNITHLKHKIPNKGIKSLMMASELACWDIYNYLISV